MEEELMHCPKCDGKIKEEKEKEIDYPYVCKSCNENFYEFEVKEDKLIHKRMNDINTLGF